MTELFQPDRHTELSSAPWSGADARAAIGEIAASALDAFDAEKFWPAHPLDAPGVDGMGGLYMGASGIVLALDHLKQQGAIDYTRDFRSALPAMSERDAWVRQTPFGKYGALLMGDLGPMLLAMRLTPSQDLADRIFARIEGNNPLPPLELMWGMAGSMLGCVFMHARTGETRWANVYRIQAKLLLRAVETVKGFRVWTQELYGQRRVSLGLVHGFAGNMLAFAQGWPWLSEDQRNAVEELAVETLAATAKHDGGSVNWPANADNPDAPMLCQICHGAPGIVYGLSAAPFSTPQFEALLLGAGELIRSAGPLAKGSNFCHGTGGNGYALLKLYKRTGDLRWLERARAFAMASIAQFHTANAGFGRGRFSLWTGDIGLACFLWDCVRGEPAFPSLDFL